MDDFNTLTNDNVCDITQEIAIAIIKAMNFKMPNVHGGIEELFELNSKIREVVAGVIERVRDAGDLHIKNFHLFDGHAFALLDMPVKMGMIFA